MRERENDFYAFGTIVIDTAQQLVLRDGIPVPLTPKTYDTLLVLVKNPGRVMPKTELMQALWPDSFVEEANLTQQISVIRKALGDAPGADPYIVTVVGKGYRFAAEVKHWSVEIEVFSSAPVPASAAPAAAGDVKAREAGAKWRTRSILPWLTVIVMMALIYFGRERQPALKQVPAGPRSLAILPFQSLKKDLDSEFLGFSLADAIITRLGYVNSLIVRPSYSIAKYRNQTIDTQKAAADLRVNTLLTGTYIREGDLLRITSQLIDVPAQKILWKDTFDLRYERLLSVQDSVATKIIKQLELSLSPQEGERLRSGGAVSPLAYEYYLRGVDLYSRNDFPTAIGMLEKSTQIDPGYALTWAHLGRAYTANASFQFGGREQYAKAQAVYDKALTIQPSLMEAQIYLANFLTDTGRAESAVPLLRKAIQANPNYAEAHWELGYAYRFGGMLKESAAECTRARQQDPVVKLNNSALNAWLYLGEYDKFLASLSGSADSAFINFYRGFGEYHQANFRQAALDFNRAFTLDPTLLQTTVGKALSAAMKQEKAEGLAILAGAESRIERLGVADPEALYKVAQAYAVLNDKKSALRLLKRSVDGGFYPYSYMVRDPLLNNIRNEDTFRSLLANARNRQKLFQDSLF